jgi:rhodanese-related sulfurtransferase
LAVHCAGIVRAGLVGSILARTGANVTLVAGGLSAWKARGYEVAEEHAAGVRAS